MALARRERGTRTTRRWDSRGGWRRQIVFDGLSGEHRYSPMKFYNQSKFANAVFGWELHRRLSSAGSPVRSVLAHPGYASTNLQTGTPVAMTKVI
ncbi:hypothetical protein [Amycolatopsis taiwanensis]|uniref:hypothetical protein n=1 Tax=Amycolatopsis taiwanensis TaxID=342230 RepID=UPI000480F321|nr:hypothetical protein [Amycolatopsis taiwanensis]